MRSAEYKVRLSPLSSGRDGIARQTEKRAGKVKLRSTGETDPAFYFRAAIEASTQNKDQTQYIDATNSGLRLVLTLRNRKPDACDGTCEPARHIRVQKQP